jgi:hypothetical protein
MDTLKTVIKRDTLVIRNLSPTDKIQQQTTVETITYKNETDCWLNLCNCKILSDLFWPFTILIIVFIFQKQFKAFIGNIGDRIKKGDKIKVGPRGLEISQELSSQEINIKAENEYDVIQDIKETTNTIEPTVTKDEFIPKYLHIERRIFEVFMKYLYPKFRILSNRRIKGYEYDLIIETGDYKEFDYILEVKYYPYKFSKIGLQNIAIKLDFLLQIYKDSVNRKVKPILIIVINQDFDEGNISEIREYINKPIKNKEYINLFVIRENEIENLDKYKIFNLFDL